MRASHVTWPIKAEVQEGADEDVWCCLLKQEYHLLPDSPCAKQEEGDKEKERKKRIRWNSRAI